MKNEPTVVYNHLEEEENDHSSSGHHLHAETETNWRVLIIRFAIGVEIAAIIAMAFFMIQEMFR